jgi:acyl carrier protein
MDPKATMTQDVVLESLRSLWTSVLKRDVGPDDDFFEIGGTSLGALRMIAEVQSTYDVEIDVETFFLAPTVAKLADIITTSKTVAS